MELADSGKWGIKLEWGSGDGVCRYFTACEAAVVATGVHAVAPLLLLCATVRFTKPIEHRTLTSESAPPLGASRSRETAILLAVCVLLDGVAAALPLLSHVVPGMITLTAQVSAVSGAATWSATCALLLVLFSAEHALDSSLVIVVWCFFDMFGGVLSLADAACGGTGSSGVLWRSVGAVLVLLSVCVRLFLLLLRFMPRLRVVSLLEPEDNEMDAPDDVSFSLSEETHVREGTVTWGQGEPLPALGNTLENSSWLAQMLITWPGRVLSAARVRALFHGDVSEAPAEAHPALALDTLLLLWARPSREAAASRAATAPNHTTGWQRLGWILWRMHRVSWSMALALRVLAVMLRLAALLLLLLHVLAPPTPLLDAPSRLDADATPPGQGSGEEDSWKQRGAVAGLVLCLVVSAVIAVQGHLYLAVEEIKIRNLLWAVLYRTAISQQAHTPALCTQRFSGAKELDKVCRSVDAMASAVEGVVEQLVASLALALLLPPWGAMAAATLGACTVLRVLAVVVGGMRARLWERVMSAQADRVAACEQHLDGILALKQLAWEHAMAQRVFVLRRREQRALRSLLTMDSICDGLGHGGGLVAGCLLSFALVDLPLSSAAHPSLVPTSAHLLSGLLLVVVMWWRARMLPTYVWVVMRGKRGLEALDATLQPTTRSTHHNTCSAPPSFSPPPAPDALVVMANSQGCGGGGGGGGEESDGEAKVEQQDGEGGQLLVRLHKVSVAWPIPSQIPSPPWAERQARFWRVLEDVDLVVHAGERVAVVGGGGSGKTSLLMGLMGEASIQTLAAGPTRPWSCVVNNADAHASGFLFVSRPASVSMRRAWVEEEVSVEANVIGWQRLDPRLLSQTLDLCGLRPHGHASSTSASEAPTKRLLERCLDGGWPEQLRERVGLARCVYAAALACGAGDTGASSASGSSCPPSCLVLLDEPLASIEPVHVRMQQLERILRSSLLSRAGIVLACRDSRISHLGVNKVLLLRSSRALAVAPPAPVSGMQTPGDSLAVASTEAARYGQSIHFDQLSESSPSVWNLDGEQEQGEGSSYLLLQPTDDSGSDDNADSPLSSAQPSPQRPKRVRATYGEEGGVVTTEETEDGQAWGQWLMMNRRPHGAGGVCHCEWGCKGLEQLETSCRRYPFPRAGPSTTQQAHLGRTLVKMLHGNKTRTAAQDEDDVVLTCAPACLVLLHGIAAASCVCAPYVLMLVFGESLSSSPDSAAATARLQASPGMIPALPCPPWTPCSCNCTIRVAGAWQAVSQQVSTGDHSPFVYMYCGMLASACLCALVGCIVASGVSTALSASVAAAGQGRWRWNASRQAGHGGSGSVEQDDVVLRVVMRASRAVCTALLQPEMIDRLKCALRASDSVPSLDAVPSRVPLCQPVCARQALLGVVVHATYIAVAIAWLVVVWPTLALVVSVLMLWGAYLGAQLSCSRMQLETLWRTPACTQLDRLWVALRNGVELRACQGAREAEEAAMYVSLSRAAAMSMTCVGTHLLSTLRLQLLGITLTCLPAVLAAVSSHPASTQGHDTRAGGAVYLDELLLAGLGVLVGLWCWAHWDALFVSFGSLAQGLSVQWRLQTLAGGDLLEEEALYRARCPAANASHNTSNAILSALQKRGLSETWRRSLCSGSSSRQQQQQQAGASLSLINQPSLSLGQQPGSARHPAPVLASSTSYSSQQMTHAPYAVELESVQLVDGMLTLGGDGGYLACNGFTEPLRARLRDGGLLWVGGAAVIRDDRNRARGGGGGEARHGLASVLGGWGRVAAGRVLVGGDDVSQLPLSEVRRQVVVVSPRQPLLVSGTVRQNLDLLGKAQGDWEIWAALEQCLFADVVRSWPGKLDCVVQASGCGNAACVSRSTASRLGCSCLKSQMPHSFLYQGHADNQLPSARAGGRDTAASVGMAGVHHLSLHQAQMLGLARAVLASALNGSRVFVVDGLDDLVERHAQHLLISRQMSLGMTTVLISGHSHARKCAQAPPVLEIPGALAILVKPDGSVRHFVGRSTASGQEAKCVSGQSEASDNEHAQQYDVNSDGLSDTNSAGLGGALGDYSPTPKKKKRSVAGHAGKVLAMPFKGIGKAGRIIGRTVASAPSLLPARANSFTRESPS